ncbi:MAG: heavy-metal-associated domain-containing protein [Microthrixaceae bacterium]
MTTDTFTVTGMTCGHCVQAVKDEVGAIDGVRDVHVDLDSGQVVVHADAPVPPSAYDAAVDEAGYGIVR